MCTSMNEEKIALHLEGGGARGAYQVGVLKEILKWYPRHAPLPFKILCGTSAGAINASAMACFANNFSLAVYRLEEVWRNFRCSHIYYDDFMHVIKQIGKNLFYSTRHHIPSILNTTPLRHLLLEKLPLERINKHINNHYIDALSIGTSRYNDPATIYFFQGKHQLMPWYSSNNQGRKVDINIDHLMASSAIPVLFPSIKIKNEHFGDGSITQINPLNPTIYLGADKIFIINLENKKEDNISLHNTLPPTISQIIGQLITNLFRQTLNSDLHRMTEINQLQSLLDQKKGSQSGFRSIDSFMISPSQNLDTIAKKHFDRLPTLNKIILRILGVKKESNSKILSYMMFDSEFCKELIDLGIEDAKNNQDKIKDFLNIT